MILKLPEGGMGDIVAISGAVREIHRVYPNEPIEVQTGGRCMEVFRNNPHLSTSLGAGEKIIILQVERDRGMNIVESFAKQAGVDAIDNSPEIWLTPDEIDKPKLHRPDNRPVLAVDIWSRAETRRWPWERWAEVCEKLKPYWNILEVGHRDPDYRLHKVETRLIPSAYGSMVGKLSIRQNAALLKQVDLFVGMDSGGVHLAAAVGTPQVCLYSRSPWHSRAYWNTVPVYSKLHGCFDRCDRKCVNPFEGPCLEWITPKMVIEAVNTARSRFKIKKLENVTELAHAAYRRGNGVLAPTQQEIKQRDADAQKKNPGNGSVRSGHSVPVLIPEKLILRRDEGIGRVGRKLGRRNGIHRKDLIEQKGLPLKLRLPRDGKGKMR